MGTLPFALQLYTVRDHAERDFAGALQQVKEIGYDHVELAGLAGMTPTDYRVALADAGLTPIGAHFSLPQIRTETARVAQTLQTLGVRSAVVSWADAPTKAEWIEIAAVMDAAGGELRREGIQLCYHNHAHEFRVIDGDCALDILLGACTPEHVALELDVYWAQFGNVDPVMLLEKYATRIPLLHVKDMAAEESRTFAEVGQGILDWPPIFAAAKRAGVEWYIVEQDLCPGDSLESARISAQFMSQQ